MCSYLLWQLNRHMLHCIRCGANAEAREVMDPTSISEPNKVQQIQFQKSGTLLFMGVQKLYEPEISWF